MLVEIHGPGHYSSKLLTIHPKLINQGRHLGHLFEAQHDVGVEASSVVMPEFSGKNPIGTVLEEGHLAGSGAAGTADRPDVVLYLVGMRIALLNYLMIAQVAVLNPFCSVAEQAQHRRRVSPATFVKLACHRYRAGGIRLEQPPNLLMVRV